MVISVSLGAQSYPILLEPGALARAGAHLSLDRRVLVVTDSGVPQEYAQAIASRCRQSRICTLPAGEGSKSMDGYHLLLREMLRLHMDRGDCVAAVGGGMVGDLAGFAAATYMRGVDFYNIPTTLLAQVDSSVGGKTGVNLPEGKNLAGAFHQPSLVLCDPDCFNTLSDALFADGAAESIKYGIIADESLFEIFEFGDVKGNIENIVRRCVEIKSDIVSRDEFDLGERQKLNLGHTLGHAIERCSDFAVSHGHAVAIGTVRACLAAQKLGVCKEDISERVKKTLERNGLPVSTDISVHELASVMQRDKKRSSAGINLILPTKIGECILYNTDPNELESIYSL